MSSWGKVEFCRRLSLSSESRVELQAFVLRLMAGVARIYRRDNLIYLLRIVPHNCNSIQSQVLDFLVLKSKLLACVALALHHHDGQMPLEKGSCLVISTLSAR